ncbi:hypothetical protein GYMLUDRAFT_32614, partial [Collybiopsis luxurians FD-317 M1]
MSCPNSLSDLPSELIWEILRWATHFPEAYNTSYTPFCSPESQATCRDTALSCSLVCREWRALVTEFLYRDVCIGYGQTALKGALCNKQASRFVRRAILPFQYTSTPSWTPNPLPSVEILKLCNHLEVLIRPQSPPFSGIPQQFQFEADSLPLPSLKRLEWNYNIAAEPSGGVNSLGATLQSCSNLEYLSIDSVPRSPVIDHRPVSLPFLSTLSVSSLSGQLMYQIVKWFLPALKHLVLGAVSVPDTSYLWETYGGQIESLELGRHASFLVRDVISSALENCLYLQELNYHLFFTLPPIVHEAHESIHTIGLHAAQNLMFSPEDNWVLVEKHFAVLIEYLPSLRTVQLFGNWDSILGDSRFAPIYTQLRERGCELVF